MCDGLSTAMTSTADTFSTNLSELKSTVGSQNQHLSGVCKQLEKTLAQDAATQSQRIEENHRYFSDLAAKLERNITSVAEDQSLQVQAVQDTGTGAGGRGRAEQTTRCRHV